MTIEELKLGWNEIKENIRDIYRISDVSYNTWIRDLELGSLDQDVLSVCIPSDNPLMLSYYEKNTWNRSRPPYRSI